MDLNTESWQEFYLNKIYKIRMGNGFDKIQMADDEPTVNFVSRISYGNGVDCAVNYVEGIAPFKAGLLTVALGGSYLGSCFVQEKPFYTGQNVAVMESSEEEMTHNVNLFISCLVRYESKVKYYAFGRELNSHINRDFAIKLPIKRNKDGTPFIDDTGKYSDAGYIPDWKWMDQYIYSLHNRPLTTKNVDNRLPELSVDNWGEFCLERVFVLKGGFYNKKPEHSIEGRIPFLASTESNNGVTEFYSLEDIMLWDKVGNEDNTLDRKIYDGNCIAVTVNGSVCNAFYQAEEFTCSHDITALYLKGYEMNPGLAMFLCTIIMRDKYRWSYGRKPHDIKKFGKSSIKLPIKRSQDGTPYIDDKRKYSDDGYIPDWEWMEKYIKSLPYGDRL